MAKGIDEKINNIETPWEGYTGSRVEEFIKGEVTKLNSQKMGYIVEDSINGEFRFYSSEDAYNNDEASLGSITSSARYTMDVYTDENNKYIFLSNDGKKEFVWYFKTTEIATNKTYYENVAVDYKFNNHTQSSSFELSTNITSNPDPKNNDFTKVVLNLDEYLTNGTTTIEINIKGLRTKQESPINREIQIVNLTMEDATDFSKPFSNNFIALVKINCTKSQQYNFEYRIDGGDFKYNKNSVSMGEGILETKDYTIDISELPNGRHVFEYRLFINLNAELYYTDTQRIEFIKNDGSYVVDEPQILIFSTYQGSDDSVIKAEDGNLIINGVLQYIPYTIKYAVYNSNASTNLEFYEVINGVDSNPIKATVYNGVIANYSIQSIENGRKTIKILSKIFENGDIESEGIVTNGEGRIIYLNVAESDLKINVFDTNLRIDFSSVGKTNNSTDKTKWDSIVNRSAGGSFINHAYFNEEYDWSQGWTTNGLVVSDGCEVTFDYVPFPLQKTNPTPEESREYVGGEKGYTFEIEFMTQNVTDENAVVCDMTYNNYGLLITGSEFKFTTPNGNSVNTRFKSEEMNRAVIVIRPYLDSNQKFAKGLVELYMNGVLSNITKYTEEEQFQVLTKDENGNNISKPLTFRGVNGSDIVIKYIRAYNGTMSSDNVVDNYIVYRTDSKEMLNLYNKNNVMNNDGKITPDTMAALGNIPMIIFIGRTDAENLASGDGNEKGDEPYKAGTIDANEENWYQTLENTTNKKKNIDMDVIYYNPLDKTKNFKFVKAYITPQGTSSMYYPKKNYRIYTQKNKDTRVFLSTGEAGVLELEQMLKPKFGEDENDRKYEMWRGTKNYKKRKYSFKDNAQAVKCWCLKADFAETSSSHNTGVARLWGDTLKNSTVSFGNEEKSVFKTNAQATIQVKYNNNINGDMPDVRTTVDGFPIVVFGAKSYSDEIKFLGQYNFNNDKSTESVFGFCDIDDEDILTSQGRDTTTSAITTVEYTLDNMLDKYMSCVETLDNGNALANFSTMEEFDEKWEDAFEFRYPEIVEEPDEDDYKDDNGNWVDGGEEEYNKDYAQYEIDLAYWKNTHLKPFKHFAQWILDTRWCDVNGDKLPEITEAEALRRKEKFAKEKWDHLDVWKMAAYYIYAMRFGAVDQIVKNSMLTSEGPFAYDKNGAKMGYWDTTEVEHEDYGRFYKWYYINYDNDTILGVKNDGRLVYGPEINRKSKEGSGSTASYVYAGSTSTLWNNFDADEEFQNIVRIADQGLSKTMTYKKAINMFDVEQVGKWCERIYNKDADYKYINPYIADWKYEGSDENAENFTDKLFMLQGSRTAHRRWWMSKRFNLFDGKWNSGEFATKYVEVKCDYGSIGDTFSAVAGSNAYFGYQINNKTFGDGAKDGGSSFEYQSYEPINWKLYKNIQIGDPIAIFGSADMLELNLMGLSKNLSSVLFYFGGNTNKLERLKLSIPDELLFAESSYSNYSDDEVGTVNRKTAYQKLQLDYPEYFEGISEDDWVYETTDEEFDATLENAPLFYRSIVTDEDGEEIGYVYFAKVTGGIRNYSCREFAFDSLDKLQELYMAGYMNLKSINLSKNKFISSVDTRYSNISKVTFAEGARIKDFKASSVLDELTFNSCNNITLDNIIIDNETLVKNQGKNLKTINITNSDGLNRDNNFKNFILNWINSGNISDKSLTLKGIKWNKVTVANIKDLLKFIKGDETTSTHAISCNISGILEMSSENISRESMNIIDEFRYNTEGIDVTVVIGNNILIDNAITSCVAGEIVKIGCDIFPNKQDFKLSGGTVEYSFVKEVKRDDEYDNKMYDSNTGKYYVKIEDAEVREGVELKGKNYELDENYNCTLKTTEEILFHDTKALLCVILSIRSNTWFDVIEFTIKDPTYAVKGNIKGTSSINGLNETYKYDLSLFDKNNLEPIGTVDIRWGLSDFIDAYNENTSLSDFIVSSAISNDNKTLTLVTHNENSPERIAKFNINVRVDNFDESGYDDFNITQQITILNSEIIMTDETNPTVMRICKNAFNTESNMYMTRTEAANITSLGDAFKGITDEFSFNELVFFTSLETIDDEAFKNSNITSITLPDNITTIGNSIFEGCTMLKDVVLSESISEIPKKAFLNCSSLENLYLPDSIVSINENAFGGVKIQKILFNDVKTNENKTIFISKSSELISIKNSAFETTKFTVNIGEKEESRVFINNNELNEISIPNNLLINANQYDFLTTTKLQKINLSDESMYYLEDNILYSDSNKDMIIRVIPKNETILEKIVFEDVSEILHYAFYGCKWIKEIVFSSELNGTLPIGSFSRSDFRTIDLSATNVINIDSYSFCHLPYLENLQLPVLLQQLGNELFVNCINLKYLELPDTVKTIMTNNNKDAYLFVNCGFIELNFPDNFAKNNIFNRFINDCPNLKKVKLPSFANILYNARVIVDCEMLEEVILPVFEYKNINDETEIYNSTLRVGQDPFIDKCPNLKKYILNDLECSTVFFDNENGAIYKMVFNENNHDNEGKLSLVAAPYNITDSSIFFIDDLKLIGDGAFGYCELTDIVIPDNIEDIGSDTFRNCTKLKNVFIGKNVKHIKQYVFLNCVMLETITFVGDVEKIDTFAFNYCDKLHNINMLSSIVPNITTNRLTNIECNGEYYVTHNFHPFGYRKGALIGVASNELKTLCIPYDYELGSLNDYDKEVYTLVRKRGSKNSEYKIYDEYFIVNTEEEAYAKLMDGSIIDIENYEVLKIGGVWINPLLNPKMCNFKKEIFTLNNITNNTYINLKVFINGIEFNDSVLYFKSHSGNLKHGDGSVYSSEYNNGYKIMVDNNLYHNEPISVYTDRTFTEESFVGEFIVKYGVNEYTIGEEVMLFGLTRNTSFEDKSNEIINISKKEYEILLSRVNQMADFISKLKL